MVVQYISFAFLLFSIFIMSSCAAAKLSSFPLSQQTTAHESTWVQDPSVSFFSPPYLPSSTSTSHGGARPLLRSASPTPLPHFSDSHSSDASLLRTLDQSLFSLESSSAQTLSDARGHGLSVSPPSDHSIVRDPELSVPDSFTASVPVPDSARHGLPSAPSSPVPLHGSAAASGGRERSSSSAAQPSVPVSVLLDPTYASPALFPVVPVPGPQLGGLSDRASASRASAVPAPGKAFSAFPQFLALPRDSAARLFSGTVNVPSEQVGRTATVAIAPSDSSPSYSLLAVREEGVDNQAAAGWARAAAGTEESLEDVADEGSRVYRRQLWTDVRGKGGGGDYKRKTNLSSDGRRRGSERSFPVVAGSGQQLRREGDESGRSLTRLNHVRESVSDASLPSSSSSSSASSPLSGSDSLFPHTRGTAGSRPSGADEERAFVRKGNGARSVRKFLSRSGDPHSSFSVSEQELRDAARSKTSAANSKGAVMKTADKTQLLRSSPSVPLDGNQSHPEREYTEKMPTETGFPSSLGVHSEKHEGEKGASWWRERSTEGALLSVLEDGGTQTLQKEARKQRRKHEQGGSPEEERSQRDQERGRGPSPFGDRRFGQLFSTFIAAYSYVTVVPCWANEMTAEVRVKRISSGFRHVYTFVLSDLCTGGPPEYRL